MKAKETPANTRPRKRAPLRDVMTLAETARFLRVTSDQVQRMISEQELPGRQIGRSWRFLRSAVEEWLKGRPSRKDRILAQSGAFRDDAYLEEMLDRIFKERARPVAADE